MINEIVEGATNYIKEATQLTKQEKVLLKKSNYGYKLKKREIKELKMIPFKLYIMKTIRRYIND